MVADVCYTNPNLTQLSASLCKAHELNKDNVRKLHQFKSTLHSITSPVKIKHLCCKKKPTTGLPTAPVWDESVTNLPLTVHQTGRVLACRLPVSQSVKLGGISCQSGWTSVFQLQGRTASPFEERTLAPFRQEAGWVSERLWMRREEDNSALAGNRSAVLQ
jgi:hypothetical protein